MTDLLAGQKVNYFAYGANTNHQHLRNLCPAAKWLGSAVLADHKLCWRYHLDIERTVGHCVHGAVWSISLAELDQLDHYEGYPTYYTRKQQMVSVNGDNTICWVYEMPVKGRLNSPHHRYYNQVYKGYLDSKLPLNQLLENLP